MTMSLHGRASQVSPAPSDEQGAFPVTRGRTGATPTGKVGTHHPMAKDTEVPSHVNSGREPEPAGPAARQARKDF
jgi:hypothetical protein